MPNLPAHSPAASRLQPASPVRHLARVVLTAFLFTFIASRVLVILIMSRTIPDLFLHLGGTHVHHLNYGIFLLSALGGYLLFAQKLAPRRKDLCALVYGLAMGMTFDEFGMWLHLGGGYWQRASFDAVIVISSLLALIAFAPKWEKMRSHHFATGLALLAAVGTFYVMLWKSLGYAGERIGPKLERLERSGPQ
ncbi:MAG TPA: hypothetical protein VNQ90_07925 [Chthoniobacteraceae bacterium]|nr:hypothetical protein [Chthoniobacteraceae bacterium]